MKDQTIPPPTPLPHDWLIATWPPGLFPYNVASARHLVYVNQNQLVAAGALVRIGHRLVILGAGYLKWLASHASRVPDYEIGCNRPEHEEKKSPAFFPRAKKQARC